MPDSPDAHSKEPTAPDSDTRQFGELVEKVELFRRLPDTWKRLVVELLEEEHFDEDEIIFQAGDPADCVYIVELGNIVLYTDTVGEPIQQRAQLKRGSVFGELGVLEGSRRCLSARATEASALLRLDGTELLRLAKAHDDFARELCQVAIGYASSNVAARAELARRKEARIKIGRRVEVRVQGRDALPVVLEDLSLGGACLSGVPDNWQIDESVPVAMATDPTTALFRVHASIQWRKDDLVGLCFTRTFDDHQIKIAGAVHRLTVDAKAEASS